jgi:hypothetical protein
MFKQLYGEAEKTLSQNLEYYPDSTIADQNPWQQQANQNVANMVNAGSEGLDAAEAENTATMRGDYLSPDTNPWLREVGDYAARDASREYNRTVMPGIASRFGGAGRSAGPQDSNNAEGNAMASSQHVLGQEMGQMYANLYGGAYESERGRMGQAVGMAPGLRTGQFQEQAAMSAAGMDEFKYAQMQLSDQVNRFNFEQYEPYERLGRFQGLISQPGGGYGQTTQTSSMGGAQVAGLGIAGASALGSFIG